MQLRGSEAGTGLYEAAAVDGSRGPSVVFSQQME